MRRRLVLSFAALVAGMIAVVATLPFWLGAAVKGQGRSRGVTFASYERLGYSRFAFHDVEVRHHAVRVTASRVEAETPLVWLWHRWRNRPAEIVAGTWRVEVLPSAGPRTPNPDRGWMALRAQLQKIGARLDHWLPRASAGAGSVHWPGGEISLDTAQWSGRKLVAGGVAFRALTADATVAFAPDGDALRVTARTTDGAMAANLESRGPAVTGDVALWEQPGTLSASFAPRGWIPPEASLRAQDWSIPGERVKLGELYAFLRGTAQIEWRRDRFIADINAAGEPLPNRGAPPLELVVRANGDGREFTFETLHAVVPGVFARLSEPFTVDRSGRIRENAARFALQVDLAQQPWFAASGTVNGEARLVSDIAASPTVDFTLDARDLRARDVSLSAVNARGRLEWPRLQIAAGTIRGGEGEQLEFRGGWDFRAKEILAAQLEGSIRRQSIARWLPQQPEFDVIRLKAEAAGPLAEVKHTGNAQAEAVKVRGMNPLAVSADWRGRGAVIEHFGAEAVANATKVVAAGTLSGTSLQLTALNFTQGGTLRLQLREPATIRWRPQLQLESLHLSGPEGNLNAFATAGEKGRIEVSARAISSKWFSDLVPPQGPPWHLDLLALIGTWDRGPMAFTLTAGAALDIGEGRTASVMAAVRGDKDGVRVEALRATEGDATVVNATGRMPVTFTPAGGAFMHIDASGPLRVDATVAPNAAFWQKLAVVSGVELKEPQASAHLTGTWQRPQGNANLKAARIAIDPRRVARPLPTIESLDVRLTGDTSGVILNTFSVRVEGQEVRAEGRLPVPDGTWGELFKEPLVAARRGADLRLEIPDAEVAVFTRFLPAVLAPKGRLQADLQYKSGGLEGFLRLRDAASRPLGPLGVLQEINADIAMSGRKLALRGVTARSGGQPITLSGTVELPENGHPLFDLALKGGNLPFVRQTGLLVRGDLDLKLQTPERSVPRLSGTVRLRDSLFLSDLRAFLPKGGASASRRPPYFAIETPPVNTWALAVDVGGEEFMRLRTPVFAGVASARFRLSGTLGEPRALGEILIDEGRVRMPFASFEVTQGSVRLTEADPFEPAIYLRGTGRRWGYDLTMEIEGSASRPNVVFTSSPGLDSEQVLAMVMTGAAPSNDIARTGTQRIASIGYFIGQSLLGSLGADAADADRLMIASGEKISRKGEETYEIEYKLSDRWTLTAEKNEFDEYNAGVKWRVFRGAAATAPKDHAKK